MSDRDGIYVIDPSTTDPDLLKQLVPLGDGPQSPPAPRPTAPRPFALRRVNRRAAAPPVAGPRPAHPALLLAAAHLLGPVGVFVTGRGRGSHGWRILAAVAGALGASTIVLLGRGGRIFTDGDDLALAQMVSLALTAATGFLAWSGGVVLASRSCGGPWSQAGRRRPWRTGAIGLVAPGLGYLLGGHRWRAVLAGAVAMLSLVAAAVIVRFPAWWAWHRASTSPWLHDGELEGLLIGAVAVGAIGVAVWITGALDSARLAAGTRFGQAATTSDRLAVLLLVTLIALGVTFRPGEIARVCDHATARFTDAGLVITPLVTAQAAAALAPAEPIYAWRLAARYAALGRYVEATAIRARIAASWRPYEAARGMTDPPARTVAAPPPAI